MRSFELVLHAIQHLLQCLHAIHTLENHVLHIESLDVLMAETSTMLQHLQAWAGPQRLLCACALGRCQAPRLQEPSLCCWASTGL